MDKKRASKRNPRFSAFENRGFLRIVKPTENRPVLPVLYAPDCALLFVGRQPACVVGLVRHKKFSQILSRFSMGMTIKATIQKKTTEIREITGRITAKIRKTHIKS